MNELDRARLANETYGRAREAVYWGTFGLSRAFAAVTSLLETGDWRICGGGFDDVGTFIDSLGLDQFRFVADQRKDLVKAIKAAQATVSNRAIASALGVSPRTVDYDTAQNCAPDQESANRTNGAENGSAQNCAPGLSGSASARLTAGREARKVRDLAANETRLAAAPDGPGSIEFRRGDFRAVLADLKGVDAIVTDPPYGREYLPLMRDLAAFADRVLKPDGVMAVLYGQTWLPEAMAQMTGFRPYRWTACYLTEGAGYVSMARRAQSNWKPLIVYGGGPRFADVFRSGGDGEAKERHPWGQDYGAFSDIIAALTVAGATVVDPFAGGGTTLMAAKALGRHAIGCDIDPRFEL